MANCRSETATKRHLQTDSPQHRHTTQGLPQQQVAQARTAFQLTHASSLAAIMAAETAGYT